MRKLVGFVKRIQRQLVFFLGFVKLAIRNRLRHGVLRLPGPRCFARCPTSHQEEHHYTARPLDCPCSHVYPLDDLVRRAGYHPSI